jgi:hypothetical protein
VRKLRRVLLVLPCLAALLLIAGGSATGSKERGHVLYRMAKGQLKMSSHTVFTVKRGGRTVRVMRYIPQLSGATIVSAQEALGVKPHHPGAADFSSGSAIVPNHSGGRGGSGPQVTGMGGSHTLGCGGRTSNGNTRVNQDCTYRRQAEEDIAYNPRDVNNLIGGQNDSRTGFNQCSFAWSTNNGSSWGDEIPPSRQKVNAPQLQNPVPGDPNRHTIRGDAGTLDTYDAFSDPVMAFDALGRSYFSCVGFDVFDNESILYVTQSPQGAQGSFYFNIGTVDRQFVVAEDNSAEIFHDKQFMDADKNLRLPNGQANPRAGNAYVTWTVFRFSAQCVSPANPGGYCESPIFGSMTTDGGRHWSTPELISGSAPGICTLGNFFDPALSPSDCNQDQGSDPIVLPNGDLVVTFLNANGPGTTLAQELAVHCSPSGDSVAGTAHLNCAPPRRVAKAELAGEPLCELGRGPEECIPGAFIRTNPFPRISVNDDNGHVFVVWQDYLRRDNAAKEWSIQISKSTDGGLNWTPARTVNPDTGLDHYFPATDVAEKHHGSRVGVSYYRTERVPNETGGVFGTGTTLEPGVGEGNSDYVLSGGREVATPFNLKIVSPVFPPPDGIQTGFNGDYSGLTINKGSDAHPIWSDTRNVDPYAPLNGVIHDEDVFTDNVGLPNGTCSVHTGAIGRRSCHGHH